MKFVERSVKSLGTTAAAPSTTEASVRIIGKYLKISSGQGLIYLKLKGPARNKLTHDHWHPGKSGKVALALGEAMGVIKLTCTREKAKKD